MRDTFEPIPIEDHSYDGGRFMRSRRFDVGSYSRYEHWPRKPALTTEIFQAYLKANKRLPQASGALGSYVLDELLGNPDGPDWDSFKICQFSNKQVNTVGRFMTGLHGKYDISYKYAEKSENHLYEKKVNQGKNDEGEEEEIEEQYLVYDKKLKSIWRGIRALCKNNIWLVLKEKTLRR